MSSEADPDTLRMCRAILDDFINANDLRKPLEQAWLRLNFQPHLFLPGLYHLVKRTDDPLRRLAAAALLYSVSQKSSHLAMSIEWASTSSAVLVQGIKSEDQSERTFAARLLIHGSVPAAATTQLRRLARHRNDDSAVAAGVVLSRLGSQSRRTTELLVRGLSSSRADVAEAAGKALAQQAVEHPDAASIYFDCILSDDKLTGLSVLMAADNPKLPRTTLRTLLMTVVASEGKDPALRAEAAMRLGPLAQSHGEAQQLLARVIESEHPYVLEGCALGLSQAGWRSTATIQLLLTRAQHGDDEVRQAALRGLAAFGPLEPEPAALAAIVLTDLVGTVTSDDSVMALANAMAACGDAIIDPLITIMQRHEYRHLPAIAMTLVKLGSSTALKIIERLRHEDDSWSMTMMFAIAREMGPIAAPMVPLLSELLETEADPAAAGVLLGALLATGVPLNDALHGLLRCLWAEDAELADRAERVLATMGSSIYPVLDQCIEYAAPDSRTRLMRLRRLHENDTLDPFADLRAFGNDAVLQRFAVAAALLEERGSVSFNQMVLALRHQQTKGSLPTSWGVSVTSIRSAFQAVSRHFGFGPVTTQTPGRKGMLTPEAVRFLERVRRYLEARNYEHGDDSS